MKSRADFPEYQKAVQAYLKGDARGFATYRSTLSLSSVERRLLEARALFREERWSEARALLEALAVGGRGFLAAERLFLMASAEFFSGAFEAAAALNLRAAALYAEVSDRRGRFLAIYNASVDFSRMGQRLLARDLFAEAEDSAVSDDERFMLYRGVACEASRDRRYPDACIWLEKAAPLMPGVSPEDVQTFRAVCADVFFRAGRLPEAIRWLEVPGTKGWGKARLDFELAVLRSLREKRLVARPGSLSRSVEYRDKWDLLSAVAGGESDRAAVLWKRLRVMSPGMFGEYMHCTDPSESDSSFWALLTLLRLGSAGEGAPVATAERGMRGNAARLVAELRRAGTPLRKEHLIERIWGVEYDPSWDGRFYKLVERARREKIKIVSSQRAYSLR